jgi:hypothetical protein
MPIDSGPIYDPNAKWEDPRPPSSHGARPPGNKQAHQAASVPSPWHPGKPYSKHSPSYPSSEAAHDISPWHTGKPYSEYSPSYTTANSSDNSLGLEPAEDWTGLPAFFTQAKDHAKPRKPEQKKYEDALSEYGAPYFMSSSSPARGGPHLDNSLSGMEWTTPGVRLADRSQHGTCIVILGGAMYSDDPLHLTKWFERVARDNKTVNVLVVDPISDENGHSLDSHLKNSDDMLPAELGDRYKFMRVSAADVNWEEELKHYESVMFVDQLWGKGERMWDAVRTKALGPVQAWYSEHVNSTYWIPSSTSSGISDHVVMMPRMHRGSIFKIGGSTQSLQYIVTWTRYADKLEPKYALLKHWEVVGYD